jgi:hypothetical protein
MNKLASYKSKNILGAALDYFRRRKTTPRTPSHEEILAAGNVPPELSVDYAESLNVLDNVVRDCVGVSRQYAGISSPTPKHFYASVLFTSLISRGISLSILAPHSPWADKLIEHWDYASAAVITRTMIELRTAFHYLCIDDCSEEEWQCRWALLNLHDRLSRKRLLESYSGASDDGPKFEAQAEELRDCLRSNEHFMSLRHQRKLLNGQTPYLFSIEDMAEKAGIPKNHYRFLHIMLSSHVHGLPMSYFRMGEQERGRGLPSPIEEGYTSVCLSCAASLLANTREEVHELFKAIAISKPSRGGDA